MTDKYVIIYYPNGSKQVVRPQSGFKGGWADLVQSIGGQYVRRGYKLKFEVK